MRSPELGPGRDGEGNGYSVLLVMVRTSSSTLQMRSAIPRDVFPYLIHEGKVPAPHGAIELIERAK